MLNLAEWKEIGILCFICFYGAMFFIAIVDTIIQNKKEKARKEKELRRLRWEVAKLRCIY